MNEQKLKVAVKKFHAALLQYRALLQARRYSESENLRSQLNIAYGQIRDDLHRLNVPSHLQMSDRSFPVFEMGLRHFDEDVGFIIGTCLDHAIQGVEMAIGVLGRDDTDSVTNRSGRRSTKKVFVVHGHDHQARDEVARFLTAIDLEPLILSEEPGKGRTIIEKLEQEGNVGFAVILLTADDVGGPTASDLRGRARQNVILELGYFVGKLGRPRVTAIYQDGVEIPTDYHGVEYVPLAGDWKFRLAKELRAAGLAVDMNKAT